MRRKGKRGSMNSFEWYNPVRILFGCGVRKKGVGELTARHAKKVLLHYGGSSIHAAGTYEVITEALKEAGVEYAELGGVRPNPRLSLVREGIELCRREEIPFILAVGGGSVIDSAKAIAAGVPYPGDVWDFYEGRAVPERALGVGVVLTIPAAGSESSNGTVLTNENGMLKRSFCSELCYPRFAILDPELCKTLPGKQIAAGGADILAHVMERYFSPTQGNTLSDSLCEGTMRTLIKELPRVLEDAGNTEAWEQIMWTGNVAHNGLLGKGNEEDWASHEMEHELSAVYDIAHGAGLAIVFPAWMKYVYREHPEKFAHFAARVMGVPEGSPEDMALEGIKRLETFFRSLGLATRLSEVGIEEEHFGEMARKACRGRALGAFRKLGPADVEAVFRLAL